MDANHIVLTVVEMIYFQRRYIAVLVEFLQSIALLQPIEQSALSCVLWMYIYTFKKMNKKLGCCSKKITDTRGVV